MKYLVLFITYFPFSIFTPFLFSKESDGQDKKSKMDFFTEQTNILRSADTFIIVHVVIEPAGVLKEAWLQIENQTYCKREFERVGETVTFSCRIDGLCPGTDYQLMLLAEDFKGDKKKNVIPFKTQALPPPLSPKEKIKLEKKKKKKK